MFRDTYRRRGSSKNEIEVILFCDTNRWSYTLTHSEIKVIGAGADAVDFALVSAFPAEKGISSWRRITAWRRWLWGKGACGIHQNGRWYTEENIDQDADGAASGRKRREHRGETSSQKARQKEQKRTMWDFFCSLSKLIDRGFWTVSDGADGLVLNGLIIYADIKYRTHSEVE